MYNQHYIQPEVVTSQPASGCVALSVFGPSTNNKGKDNKTTVHKKTFKNQYIKNPF